MKTEPVADFTRTHPFYFFNRDHLYLTCDGEGKVLRIFNPTDFNFTYIVRQLNEIPSLKNFFDFGPRQNPSALPPGLHVFPSRPEGSVHELYGSFYSNLPTLILRIVRKTGNLFLCALFLSDIVPRMYPEKKNSILYVDPGGKLVGFNKVFYDFFSKEFPNPLAMLGHGTGRFMEPPLTQMTLPGNRVDPGDKTGYKMLKEFRFEGVESLPAFRTFGKSRRSAGAGFFRWETPGSESAIITLLESFDSTAEDLIVEMELTGIKGDDPLFHLTDQAPGEMPPDIFGYTLGKNGPDGRTVLKKTGFIATWQAPYPGPRPSSHILQWRITGTDFYLFHGGQALLHFPDPNFLGCDRAAVALSLRGGSACRIRNVKVFTRPKRGTPPPDLIVKLKTSGARYFFLNPFYTYDLTAKFPGVMGFWLHDVTPLQTQVHNLTRKVERLLGTLTGGGDLLVGESPAFLTVKSKAAVAAGARATVLIEGPTGSGKEMVAHYIHGHSDFKTGPFVKVDCATIPQTLMESSLFGYEKGAFTGADKRKIGLFETAGEGTIFLDEVENLTPEVQAKLLRFLQDFSIFRVGGSESVGLNIRVIAASNANLAGKVKSGSFREDLYYRLCVVRLELPPLSRRKDDIPALCAHFLEEINLTALKKSPGLSADAFKKMYAYDWPGNLRELKNTLERAVIFAEGGEITGELLDLPATRGPVQKITARKERPPGRPYHLLSKMTAAELQSAIEKVKGNVHALERELGVTRRALYYHVKRAGIELARFRA